MFAVVIFWHPRERSYLSFLLEPFTFSLARVILMDIRLMRVSYPSIVTLTSILTVVARSLPRELPPSLG